VKETKEKFKKSDLQYIKDPSNFEYLLHELHQLRIQVLQQFKCKNTKARFKQGIIETHGINEKLYLQILTLDRSVTAAIPLDIS
jgi:hypothetical protein